MPVCAVIYFIRVLFRSLLLLTPDSSGVIGFSGTEPSSYDELGTYGEERDRVDKRYHKRNHGFSAFLQPR